MGRYVYPAGHERTFGGIAIGKAASESTAFFEIIVPLRLRIMQIYFTSLPVILYPSNIAGLATETTIGRLVLRYMTYDLLKSVT